MKIRKAQIKDIGRIIELLSQVLELHAKLRPDIFVSGTTKYTEKELKDILQNPKTPVFVAVNDRLCNGICIYSNSKTTIHY